MCKNGLKINANIDRVSSIWSRLAAASTSCVLCDRLEFFLGFIRQRVYPMAPSAIHRGPGRPKRPNPPLGHAFKMGRILMPRGPNITPRRFSLDRARKRKTGTGLFCTCPESPYPDPAAVSRPNRTAQAQHAREHVGHRRHVPTVRQAWRMTCRPKRRNPRSRAAAKGTQTHRALSLHSRGVAPPAGQSSPAAGHLPPPASPAAKPPCELRGRRGRDPAVPAVNRFLVSGNHARPLQRMDSSSGFPIDTVCLQLSRVREIQANSNDSVPYKLLLSAL
jgi:hypothetical protein